VGIQFRWKATLCRRVRIIPAISKSDLFFVLGDYFCLNFMRRRFGKVLSSQISADCINFNPSTCSKCNNNNNNNNNNSVV
jgi:hypothetical protein